MHRDRELWGEDAENFKPERWSDAKPTWEYLPFNGGPEDMHSAAIGVVRGRLCNCEVHAEVQRHGGSGRRAVARVYEFERAE